MAQTEMSWLVWHRILRVLCPTRHSIPQMPPSRARCHHLVANGFCRFFCFSSNVSCGLLGVFDDFLCLGLGFFNNCDGIIFWFCRDFIGFNFGLTNNSRRFCSCINTGILLGLFCVFLRLRLSGGIFFRCFILFACFCFIRFFFIARFFCSHDDLLIFVNKFNGCKLVHKERYILLPNH